MYIRILLICVLFAFLTPNVAVAQDDKTDFQSWTDFTTYIFISDQSALGGDFGVRGMASSRGWTQWYIRPTYRFQYNSLDLAGGVALFYTNNKEFINTTELRLFQQATLHWPKTHLLKFNHRIRFEQRFFYYQNLNPAEIDNDNATRVRYQLMIRTRDFNILNQKIYFKTAIEFFQKSNSAKEAFVNQNRLVLAVGHRFKGKWWYEVHYIAQQSRMFEEDGLETSEHILRLRLFRAAVFRHRIE